MITTILIFCVFAYVIKKHFIDVVYKNTPKLNYEVVKANLIAHLKKKNQK